MPKRYQGSMLIGVLIMMFMMASISLAIIHRSNQSAMIATSAKQGFSAYQGSDSVAESFLNEIKKVDEGSKGLGKIPENTGTDSIGCSVGKCKNANGENAITVAQIANVQVASTSQTSQRNIAVPVPERIENEITNLKVEKCDGTKCSGFDGAYNGCYLKASWILPLDRTKISGYEIRRSVGKTLTDTLSSYGWKPVPDINKKIDTKIDPEANFFIIKNYDSDSSIDQYGNNYYFSIKVKNKDNFKLDSLFLKTNADEAPVSIKMEEKAECDGKNVLDGLGCVTSDKKPAGTTMAKVAYNCCNDTECYEVDVANNWKKSSDGKCAIQQCVSSDDAAIYPSGNSYSGYCKTAGPDDDGKCNEGEDNCSGHVYKIIGYCKSCNSGWEESRKMDVDYDPKINLEKPRCCRQTCNGWVKPDCGTLPANATGWTNESKCTPNTCGSRTETKICKLNCKTGYDPGGNTSTSDPSGACCMKQCPSYPYGTSCPSNPANGYYQNNSVCAQKCGDYSVTTKCDLVCNSGYHMENSSGGGKICVSNTRYNQSCTGLPSSAVWNTVSKITQTWNGSSWSPNTAGSYNTTASTTECRFKCNSGYHWDGSQCVSNTKTSTCSGSLPANSSWRTNGNCVQTWNGSSWDPASCATHYSNDNSQCEYTCDGGRVGYNNGCYFSCERCSTVQNHLWVKFYSTKSDCSVGTYTVERRCDTSCHTPKQPPSSGCYCFCP